MQLPLLFRRPFTKRISAKSRPVDSDHQDSMGDSGQHPQSTSPRHSVHGGGSEDDFISDRRESLSRLSIASSEDAQDTEQSDGPHIADLEHYSEPRGLSISQRGSSEEIPASPEEGPETKLWRTFFLRRSFLLGVTCLYALMICALEVLSYFSQRDNGLTTAQQNLHYLWTYGPTFVFTMVAAFWGQIEYRTKQLFPFRNMSRGPADASTTLLLNYITPFTPSVIIRSLKLGHFPVALAVLGSLLLRLLIVASTGLLSLEYRDIRQERPMRVLDRFDFSNSSINTTDTRVFPRLWAIQAFNSTYPEGTTSEVAIQSFVSSNGDVNGTISTDVEVFSGELENCEPIDYENTGIVNSTDGYFTLNIWSESCLVAGYRWSAPNLHYVPIEEWRRVVDVVECSGNDSRSNSLRIIIYRGNYNNTGLGKVRSWKPYVSSMFGIICTPAYHLDRRPVFQSTSGTINVANRTTGSLLPESEVGPITRAIVQTIHLQEDDKPWFALLDVEAPGYGFTGDSFDDTELLSITSKRAFTQLSAQWAKGRAVSLNNSVTGYASESSGRLQVQPLSLRLMEGLLALLLIISVALAFVAYPGLYGDPGSLGFYAILMKSDANVGHAFQGTGELVLRPFETRICESRFGASEKGGSLVCEASPETANEAAASAPHSSPLEMSKWWRPFASRPIYRMVVALGSLLLVVALEVLYQYSSKNTGLADVSMHGYTKYTWVFIPSLTMALIGLAFATIDFSVRILYPFQRLRLEKTRTSLRAMSFDPFGKIALLLTVETLKYRELTMAAALAATLMAPLLTVVTSGLYNPQPVTQIRDVSLHFNTWFNLSQPASDSGTLPFSTYHMGIVALVHYENLSFPKWTYEDLSFPTIEIEASQNSTLPASPFPLNVRLPAARGHLNCSVSGSYSNLNLSRIHQRSPEFDPATGRQDTGIYASQYTLPWNGTKTSCGKAVPNSFLYGGMGSGPDGLWHAYTSYGDMTIDIGDVALPMYQEDPQNKSVEVDTCDDGRFHLWYIVGRGDASFFFPELSVVDCAPYMEFLHVNTTFTMPDFQLDASNPPVPDETSARVIPVNGSRMFNIEDPISGAADMFDSTANFTVQMTPFFQALVSGRFKDGNTSYDDLIADPTLEELMRRMDKLWSWNIAQVFHNSYLSPLSPSNFSGNASEATASEWATEPLIGKATDATQNLRLVQSAVSTRILEVLLLLMAICAAVVSVLEREARILPKDPGSIAAKMSLFADSDMLEKIPDRAKAWNGEELVRDGSIFSLGWWAGRDGKRRFGIDIGRAEKIWASRA